MTESGKICLIGAGPGGLAVARALRRQGLAYDHFERHTGIGGVWDQSNPGSPMYDSAHFISSRYLSGFVGFPMPETYPDYPSHRHVLAYIHAFARAYGLDRGIRLGTGITEAVRTAEGWRVTASDGTTADYGAIVAATGLTWHKRFPDIPGTFTGEAMHAADYRSPGIFRSKRVLVIGGGNSGVDIACDAAANAQAARISLRRGYHFIPKHVFGVPADVFAERTPPLPMALRQRLFAALLRFYNGDVTRYGLPMPDHLPLASHPVITTQFLHYLSHGDLEARSDVVRFDGRLVTFRDGTSEPFDLIVYATGYRFALPFVAPEHVSMHREEPDLYMCTFSRAAPTLACFGYLKADSGAYRVFDELADLIANAYATIFDGGKQSLQVEKMIREERPDLSGGIQHVDSPRHEVYAHIATLRKRIASLRRKMGWPAMTAASFDALRVMSDADAYAGAAAGPRTAKAAAIGNGERIAAE